MSKFKENDRVVVNDPLGDRIGRVEKIFNFSNEPIYVVRLDSGEYIKSYEGYLTIVQEKEKSLDVIVIERKEFKKVVAETISALAKESKDPSFSTALTLTGVLFGMRLESKLFDSKND